MKKYLYVSTKFYDQVGLPAFPSTGAYGNIFGMRKLYWGKNAYVIKCGAYAYKVNQETFERACDLMQKTITN